MGSRPAGAGGRGADRPGDAGGAGAAAGGANGFQHSGAAWTAPCACSRSSPVIRCCLTRRPSPASRRRPSTAATPARSAGPAAERHQGARERRPARRVHPDVRRAAVRRRRRDPAGGDRQRRLPARPDHRADRLVHQRRADHEQDDAVDPRNAAIGQRDHAQAAGRPQPDHAGRSPGADHRRDQDGAQLRQPQVLDPRLHRRRQQLPGRRRGRHRLRPGGLAADRHGGLDRVEVRAAPAA